MWTTDLFRLAILRLSRETEYGLHFYRNQKIARYESGASSRRRTSVDHSGRMAEKYREVDARPASHIPGKLRAAGYGLLLGGGEEQPLALSL